MSNVNTYYTDSSTDDETWLWVGIIGGASAGGILFLVFLGLAIRGCCQCARKQNCNLLCRICRRSCRSQCGTADVSQEEGILRPYQGILENEELMKKTVIEHPILKNIVIHLNKSCTKFGFETKLVGSLKERLGKPTRVITEEYPAGLPSRSPLCTDIDVMMICKSLHTTHNPHGCDKLIIIPSISSKGFVKVMVPAAMYQSKITEFIKPLSVREDNDEGKFTQTTYFLSAELVKSSLCTTLRKLNVMKLAQKSKAKLYHHCRALKVVQCGPAVKVVIRQQMSSCTRCCMLGQCSLRLCCCMTCCLQDEELDVLFEGDFTFALKVSEWPSFAVEWINRSRRWPSQELVKTILSEGCALVPKSEWGEGLYWRYSFSEAERTLIGKIPLATLNVVLAIKGLLKRYNCPLKSYPLKSMLLWCMEKPVDRSDFWSNSENLSEILGYLLKEFLNMIKEDKCRNYFIREINLLEEDHTPKIIEILEKLARNPYQHLTTRALEKSRCCALSTMICRLMCGCHDTESTLDIY